MGVVDVKVHLFLASAGDDDEYPASRRGHFITVQTAHGIHLKEGWVGSAFGLEAKRFGNTVLALVGN